MKTIARNSITIQDVADIAGVTKATVSKVFNGKGSISPATIEAVRQAAQQINFQPNPHAQRLSNGWCSKTIALLSLHLDLGVSVRKIQTIQGLLADDGYEIPTYAFSYGVSQKLNEQVANAVAMLCRQRPRAIVCTTSSLSLAARSELLRYQKEGGIVVCYDTPTDIDCDKVVFDRHHSSYVATKHLIELGHRDIGFCNPGNPVPCGDYLDGFETALREHNLSSKKEWLFGSEVHGFGGGLYEEAGAQLANRYLQLKQRPTAMCITDDYSAMAFATALNEAGLSVPGDCSVVGHDDAPIARYAPLKMTTVTHPPETIATEVVNLVRGRIEQPTEAVFREVKIQGHLQERKSTGKPSPMTTRSL